MSEGNSQPTINIMDVNEQDAETESTTKLLQNKTIKGVKQL